MKKNYQLHIVVDKNLYETIKKEAMENEISMGDICRLKLKEYNKLVKIELMIENMQKRLNFNR